MNNTDPKYILLLIIFIVYSLYHYFTRENFTVKIIENIIVFGAVYICFYGYDYFKKKRKE